MKRRLSDSADIITRVLRRRIASPTPQKLYPSLYNLTNEWVAATSTRAWLLKDPIQDWLAHTDNTQRQSRHTDQLLPFLFSQGNKFELAIVRHLYDILGAENFIDIAGRKSPRSPFKADETFQAMLRGVPIIYDGVLHDPELKWYGLPDLLVRSDFIPRLTSTRTTVPDIAAPRLGHGHHYVVVDVKFATLPLRSDGIHILTSGSFPAYKGQLWMYTSMLEKYQGYRPNQAYILGRKYRFSSRGLDSVGSGALERLGVIDYADVDNDVPDKVNKAVEWIRTVRRGGLTMTPVPSCPELYPNMGVDSAYDRQKEHIADTIGELTSIWMVGVRERNLAHAHGITSWRDDRCTSAMLGFAPESNMGKTIDSILRVNRGLIGAPTYSIGRDVFPPEASYEFFVDFETIQDLFDDFTQIPQAGGCNLIFLIGVGYRDRNILSSANSWRYLYFKAETLSPEGEEQICRDFLAFVSSFSGSVLYHWSTAEPSCWEHAMNRVPSIRPHPNVEWYDLLNDFKTSPVVVAGCLDFRLKSMAKALHSHELIETTWPSPSGEDGVADGRGAMIAAHKAYAPDTSDAESERLMLDVIRYNEVDCRVLCEMLEFVRGNV